MMRPEEKKTTTESIALYRESLAGNNYSPESIKADLSDLAQFVGWLQTRRVDFDIPYRIARIDIVEFINHLATKKASSVTRKRKLAAIRGFLKFLKDNQIIYGNPADTIEGPIREERDPAILLKTEYKALLQVAGGNTRDLAIVMLFLQTGLRVSELVNLKLTDIDFTALITAPATFGHSEYLPRSLNPLFFRQLGAFASSRNRKGWPAP
jgi:integrase/recombinase XerC